MPQKKNNHPWVVTVDMGYGHQRATYPLAHLAHKGIINANNYKGIPEEDKKIWETSRHLYEFISRLTRLPMIGQPLFDLYDKLQGIPEFYPKRDLSEPSLQLKEIMYLIKHKDWGKDLINKLNKDPRPLVTSFFAVAFMAEYFNYQGEIYCIICDADIARVWADYKIKKSRINYFAPCYRVVERLKLYGVKAEKIFLTGFPLPEENLGGPQLKNLKHDLSHRLVNLDPRGRYLWRYGETVVKYLGLKNLHARADHPLTITFAVGGAGAQREIAADIIKSLKEKIIAKEIIVNLVAGTNPTVKKYFEKIVKKNGLFELLNKGANILFSSDKSGYFEDFSKCMRKTDVLWTKPSELSFYPALGVPIIMSPPIGSQEKFNKLWLKTVGAGITQNDPKYTNEWLFDWIESGWLAQAAMRGFLEMPRLGTYNIEKILAKKPQEMEEVRTVLQY